MNSKLQITWRGPIFDTTGYAKVGREICLALQESGIDVRIEPVNNGGGIALLGEQKLQLLRSLTQVPLAAGRNVLVNHMQPNTLDMEVERKRFKSILCMTYCETQDVPPSWRDPMRQYDAIIAASSRNATAFENVKVPAVFTVPHGFDMLWDFNPYIPPANLPEDNFRFLCVAAWQHRKGPELLFEAFWHAFGPGDKVDLICKFDMGNAPQSEHVRMRERIRNLKPKGRKVRPIQICTDRLSEKEMESLYRFSNAFVLPTRGEGLCLPLLDAAKWQIPVIVTDWGGHTDVFTKDNAIHIESALEPATTRARTAIAPLFPEIFTSDTVWAEPSLPSLVHGMRFVVDQKESVAPIIKRAAEAAQTCAWSLAAETIHWCINSL